MEAWQISDFIALKRTLGKESLLVSLSLFFLFIKGRCIKKKFGEDEVTTGYLIIPYLSET